MVKKSFEKDTTVGKNEKIKSQCHLPCLLLRQERQNTDFTDEAPKGSAETC